MRTFLGKSDFYWPLMVLAEQWQCPLYANVLSVQSSVPTTLCSYHFLQTDGLQTHGLQTHGSRLFQKKSTRESKKLKGVSVPVMFL